MRIPNNKIQKPEDELYVLGLFFMLFGGIAFIVYYFVLVPILPPNACVFLQIFHIYCPGCGGTRAVGALLQGDFLSSVWYHPVVLYTIVVFGGFMLTHTMERFHVLHIKGWKFHGWYLYGALILTIVNWILKNILLLGFNIIL